MGRAVLWLVLCVVVRSGGWFGVFDVNVKERKEASCEAEFY